MLKDKRIQRTLRLLLILLGAGLGMALALAIIRLNQFTHPDAVVSAHRVVLLFIGCAAAGAAIFLPLSRIILRKCSDWVSATERRLDSLSAAQMVFGLSGLVLGLLIAALGSQVLRFMGESMFTTACSAILYVIFGAMGLSIGVRRSEELTGFIARLPGLRDKKSARKAAAVRPKVLDASVLVDGRILEVARTGFLEGELIVPQMVAAELHRLAESADPTRRASGLRGLDILGKLRQEPALTVRLDATELPAGPDADVQLLQLTRQLGGALVTNDGSLQKIASVTGVAVLRVNALAEALRPVVAAGDTLQIALLKEGREAGQGVGYLPDGTMIVVEGGRAHLGETVEAVVSSVLQTHAGRMVFARLK